MKRLFYKVVQIEGSLFKKKKYSSFSFCNPLINYYKLNRWTNDKGKGIYLYRNLEAALQLLNYLQSDRVLSLVNRQNYTILFGIAGKKIKRDRTKSTFEFGRTEKIRGSEYIVNRFKPIGEVSVKC